MKIWKCACGKEHSFNGQPIVCVGPGHTVLIMPDYFFYRVKAEDPKPNKEKQYGLF